MFEETDLFERAESAQPFRLCFGDSTSIYGIGGTMTWGYERGRIYNRRRDIHARYGGQQQGGIITPAGAKLVIAITGEEGEQHGYADTLRPDGVFEYFGEGQKGEMRFVRGNAAIANHSTNGRSLLLFKSVPQGLRFEGEMVCEAFHRRPAPDRDGMMRSAIVFELRPLEAVGEELDLAIPPLTLEQLRQRALEASQSVPNRQLVQTSVVERSRRVATYVCARANGVCEGCETGAPFLRRNGTPYLEPHHIDRLSDGGPDHPALVIALCPNCHRRVHSGVDGIQYNRFLKERMRLIEPT